MEVFTDGRLPSCPEDLWAQKGFSKIISEFQASLLRFPPTVKLGHKCLDCNKISLWIKRVCTFPKGHAVVTKEALARQDLNLNIPGRITFSIPSFLSKCHYFLIFYLFIFRAGKEQRRRGREISMSERNIDRLPLAHPQLGTKSATQASSTLQPATRQFAGWHSIHWATPARASAIIHSTNHVDPRWNSHITIYTHIHMCAYILISYKMHRYTRIWRVRKMRAISRGNNIRTHSLWKIIYNWF